LLAAAVAATDNLVLVAADAQVAMARSRVRIFLKDCVVADAADTAILIALPLVIDERAVVSGVPFVAALHVADAIVLAVAPADVDNVNAMLLQIPSAVMRLYANRKRTGFPVLAKNVVLGIVSGHVASSS
jgi:hypothetical protein